jgi:phytoene dehydrogenase-like protein
MTENGIDSDVVVIGGGHNGLVAATYLAKAGLRVQLFEGADELGGATSSEKVFDGIDAKLSRYSYLVSLLPDQIISDLGLHFETITRRISSFTPWKESTGEDRGLLISNEWSEAERAFESLALSSEAKAWRTFYDAIATVAPAIAATFLAPLPTPEKIRELIGDDHFDLLFTRPLGATLTAHFDDDRVRGIVLTDGLIGTFTDALDSSLLANRCFLYHLVGNGDGQWRVPRGGMGSLVTELRRAALAHGVIIETRHPVQSLESGRVRLIDGEIKTRFIVAACSPRELARLRGVESELDLTEGSQLKINMVLTKLPRLKSGIDPRDAFAGTFHIDESFEELQRAYAEAAAGRLPERIPAEIYCHTLTDPSILGPELQATGHQTLTLFALHTPYQLFVSDNERVKEEAKERLLRQINRYLIDPLEECLARDEHGELAIEVKSPVDLEREIGLPLGNIFHADLTFPWRESHESIRWGSETDDPTIFLAGAGSRRGGGVSGIGGHNAAMAILDSLRFD